MSFVTVPQGFFSANEDINSLSTAALTDLVNEAFDVVVQNSGTVHAQRHVKAPGVNLNEERTQSAAHAISFVLRGALADKLNSATFQSTMEKKTDLNARSRTVLLAAWNRRTKGGVLVSSPSDSKENSTRSLQLGRLVGMEWRLGVGVSSNACASLKAPFVSLLLKIVDENGSTRAQPIELTLAQFADFSRTVGEIHQQLEGL